MYVASWRLISVCALSGLTFLTPSKSAADLFLSRPSYYSLTAATSSESSSEGDNFKPADTIASSLGSFNIVINPGAALAGNAAAMAAFNRAASKWESYISDPITVTVTANLAPLGPGIIGSASSVVLFANYNTIRNQMVLDAVDEGLNDAVTAFLPVAAQYSGFLPAGFAFDGNMQATKANLKALGVGGLDETFGVSDGNITFNSNFSFDFDSSNGVSAGQMDFETVAAHEIGHVLGFISDVDYIDFVMDNAATASDVRPTTLDLYRFDDGGVNDPSTNLEFTTKPRSMVPGNVEMFDQITPVYGATEVLFSTGDTQGDGQQASHWKDSFALGIMDPTLSFGELSPITSNDLRAFDLIGYEITVAVPEARAWLLGAVVTCLGGLGVALRRHLAAARG